MSKDTWKSKYKDDFFLLLEAGFIAVNNADEDSAVKLFRASQALKPNDTLPKIGYGYMHLCKLELKQAANTFNEVIKSEPNNEMAKTFLGITLSMNPTEMSKGEAILETSSTKSSDPDMKKLADTAMDFVNTFVKKSPSPMEIQKKKKK